MQFPEPIRDYQLCYIRYGKLWFANCEPQQVWGDDWNDAPYEHNAGDPYSQRTQEDGSKVDVSFVTFRIEGYHYDEPGTDYSNSPYSVETINAKHVAWLRPDRWSETSRKNPPIFAGETLQEVFDKLVAAGERVYLPHDLFE